MISIQAKNIATYLNTITSITNISNVYALLPKTDDDNTYLYPFVVSDNQWLHWSNWDITREALVNITVVVKKQLWVWQYEEWILHNVLSAVNDEIIPNNWVPPAQRDGINILSVNRWSTQQIAYVNNRALIVQSYFIKYKI